MRNFLADALGYSRRGWSVLPVKHKPDEAKKPAVRAWKQFQTRRPTEADHEQWFARTDLDGLAVVCGKVSGGLAVRDFDSMDGYTAWATAHPNLAATLPTAATARGRHVYVTIAAEVFKEMPDGEFRGSSGQYVLLPPSIHDTGAIYRWLIPLGDAPPPLVDPVASGLLVGHATERDSAIAPSDTARSCSTALSPDLMAVLAATLPERVGQRNAQIFQLARVLKARPEAAGLSLKDLKPIVQEWHRLGLEHGVIGTADFDSTWADFVTAWPRVRFPVGRGPIDELWERVQATPPPSEAAIYDTPGLRALVALCRGLNDLNPTGPFYLACRTAARYLGLDHATAARYLRVLVADGILRVVDKGGQSHNPRKASRFVYAGHTNGPKSS